MASFASAQAAEEAFYDALSRADLDAMMALWADDEDAVCVHPGGQRILGLTAIRQAWSAIFQNGGVDARPVDVRTHLSASCAIHHLLEQVIVRNGGDRQLVQVAVVNVYVKNANGWKILVHHASQPMAVESSEARRSSLLGAGERSPGRLH